MQSLATYKNMYSKNMYSKNMYAHQDEYLQSRRRFHRYTNTSHMESTPSTSVIIDGGVSDTRKSTEGAFTVAINSVKAVKCNIAEIGLSIDVVNIRDCHLRELLELTDKLLIIQKSLETMKLSFTEKLKASASGGKSTNVKLNSTAHDYNFLIRQVLETDPNLLKQDLLRGVCILISASNGDTTVCECTIAREVCTSLETAVTNGTIVKSGYLEPRYRLKDTPKQTVTDPTWRKGSVFDEVVSDYLKNTIYEELPNTSYELRIANLEKIIDFCKTEKSTLVERHGEVLSIVEDYLSPENNDPSLHSKDCDESLKKHDFYSVWSACIDCEVSPEDIERHLSRMFPIEWKRWVDETTIPNYQQS